MSGLLDSMWSLEPSGQVSGFKVFYPLPPVSQPPEGLTQPWQLVAFFFSVFRLSGLSGGQVGGLSFGFSFTQTDWINQVYLPENHARLKAAHTYVSEELRALGIPFLSRGAGFFIWANLGKVMQAGGV